MDVPVTGRADALEIARSGCDRDVIRHVACWILRFAAWDAVDLSRPTFLLAAFATGGEKVGQVLTVDQNGPHPVDGRQTMFDPISDGVFVPTEQAGDLVYRKHRIGALSRQGVEFEHAAKAS